MFCKYPTQGVDCGYVQVGWSGENDLGMSENQKVQKIGEKKHCKSAKLLNFARMTNKITDDDNDGCNENYDGDYGNVDNNDDKNY